MKSIYEQILENASQFKLAEIHQDEFTKNMPFSVEDLSGMGFAYARVLPSGEVWAVAPYSISNGRLFVDADRWGYRDFYCYCSYEAALLALKEFDPVNMKEPEGWHRHAGSGRRRDNGDPKKETVYW